MKKSFINVENAQCLLIPLRSVGFKGSSDCSSNDVILSCKDLTCTLRSLLPSSFWIEELYKAPGILDGGFISFCLRIQGWVMFNHALTEGWATENAFMISWFHDLIFLVHPSPLCTLWPVPKMEQVPAFDALWSCQMLHTHLGSLKNCTVPFGGKFTPVFPCKWNRLRLFNLTSLQ